MCRFKVDDLVQIADEMASAAASINNQQSYQQFIDAREKMVHRVKEMQECKNNDPLAQ